MTTYDQIRLITLDLDGTLLHEDKTISEYTLQILESLIRRGLILVPASGRNLTSMEQNILKVPGISYAICANGAVVYRLPTEEIIYQAAIPLGDALTTIDFLSQYPICYYVHTSQGVVRSAGWNRPGFQKRFPFIRFQENIMPDVADYLRRQSTHEDFSILKIGFFVLEDSLFEELLKKGSPSPQLPFTQTGDGIIEMNSVQASKGIALASLCRRLNIPFQHTLAIGDSQNDLSMLRQAGVSVAMGNALESVRATAGYQTCTNDEDGAAKFLEKFFHL